MKDENCIFCKLASGDIPSATLYEDDDFRVFLDLGPATRGHALIIPKEHYRNIYDIDEGTLSKAFVLAKQMALKLKEALKCDGCNILQNNEEAAGQTVFHFHIHLIPRYEGDNAVPGWKTGALADSDKEEIISALKAVSSSHTGR